MKHVITFVILTVSVFLVFAEEYTETFNVLSDDFEESVQDTQIIRNINGGTVIIPIFDDSCPKQLIPSFSYACKIVEEYLPPCLPLSVRVSVGRINNTSGAISKVLSRSKENFGASPYYNNVQMSVIKGVVMGEMDYNSTVTYLDYIDNVTFFSSAPDIEITYNSRRLDELSFSLDATPHDNYDFVSVAIRDLLIGLGLSSSFRLNPETGGLDNPSQEFTPFEYCIDKALGYFDNSDERLAVATSGELKVQNFSLYAPTKWQNGISLNYFIPQEDCCISNILSYNFCKGMVTRSLSDDYASSIFNNLLGWKYNFLTASSTPISSIAGSTALYIPYNGTISFADTKFGINRTVENNTFSNTKVLINTIGDDPDTVSLLDYLQSFHPYFGRSSSNYGTSISILKKDGTWDRVFYIPAIVPDMIYDMSNWIFNFEEEEYARTIDGYLRARIIESTNEYGTRLKYKTTYFVVGYLPQKVNLTYDYNLASATRSTDVTANSIRLFFSNTEGIDRIVVERLRQGARVPSKFEIPNIKQGYYDVTIDKETTFTAVAYNENGSSRSIPITVSPNVDNQTLDFKLSDESIIIETEELDEAEYNYSISTLSINKPQTIFGGLTKNRSIDITNLDEGVYVLSIEDVNNRMIRTFKFKKD